MNDQVRKVKTADEKRTELENQFTYHAPVGDQAARYQRINYAALNFARVVVTETPECADQSTALRTIREARMWANSSIACFDHLRPPYEQVSFSAKSVLTIQDVARICHEANRALCVAQGDFSQTSWENAPEWQRSSAIKGVRFNFQNPNAAPSASHESWLEEKLADGWVYGETKDAMAKTHPCIINFYELPPLQQAKDALFKSICNAMRLFSENNEPEFVAQDNPKTMVAG